MQLAFRFLNAEIQIWYSARYKVPWEESRGGLS
jgi:hypothetical protein